MNRKLAVVFFAALVSVSCGGAFGAMPSPVRLPPTASLTNPTNLIIMGQVDSVAVGQTLQLRAMATLTDNSVHDVTAASFWGSALPGIATISYGLVQTKSVGTTRIAVNYSDKGDSFLLNVK